MPGDLNALTLQEISGLVASGQVSPVDCVQASLELIRDSNGILEAFLSHDAEQSLVAAELAQTAIAKSGPRSPLHGIPVAVKDLFAVKGMIRTCGSRVFGAEKCTSDATVVARLRRAGAIVIGMTSLNEFAYGPTGINAVSATARNPWDHSRACGGSSAGSACAVASGMVWGALGTDTGGSVRIPASHCGITGLKPTFGRLSRHGIFPLSASFDHAGPLARTARDCALLLEAMCGSDSQDPATWNRPTFEVARNVSPNALKGLRIGVPRAMFEADVASDVSTVFEAALVQLQEMGAGVERMEIPDYDAAMRAWVDICLAEAYDIHRGDLRDHASELSPDVATRLQAGRDISIERYLNAQRRKKEFQAVMQKTMRAFDLLAMPTTLVPAVLADTGNIDVDGRVVSGADVLGRLMRLASLTGQPAISIPCGFVADGLPVGLQMIGRGFGEADLIAAAEAYQQQTCWHEMRPPPAQ
jgi:aspartyl-tRNA(Asn)/glutamyl-tRNA(Gln) amidotransferase subunit A